MLFNLVFLVFLGGAPEPVGALRSQESWDKETCEALIDVKAPEVTKMLELQTRQLVTIVGGCKEAGDPA